MLGDTLPLKAGITSLRFLHVLLAAAAISELVGPDRTAKGLPAIPHDGISHPAHNVHAARARRNGP